MRYIKSYNESRDFLTYNEILTGIEEVLLPISDLGYNIKVELVKDYNYHIFVNILGYENERLDFTEEVEDEFDRLYDFTKENGFLINKVYYKAVQPDGRIFNFHNRETMNSYKGFKSEIRGKKLAFLSFELKQMER